MLPLVCPLFFSLRASVDSGGNTPKQVQPGDVLVEQGRHAVSLGEMLMRPIFWPFSGQVRALVRDD